MHQYWRIINRNKIYHLFLFEKSAKGYLTKKVILAKTTIHKSFKTTHTAIAAIYTEKEIGVRTNLSKNSKKGKRLAVFIFIKKLIINYLCKKTLVQFVH